MKEIDLFSFYQKVIGPVTPHSTVSKLLQALMTGSESSEEVAGLVSKDTELQHWIRLTVQRMGFERQAAKLSQIIVLLGQNRIRDLIIGRHIERAYINESETVLGKLLADMHKAQAEAREKEREKEAEKNKGQETPKEAKKEPEKEAAPATVHTAETPDAQKSPEDAASETIPQIQDFQRYLSYAMQAENIAITIRNSYPGQAYAGGVLFDYVYYFLKSIPLDGLTDERLKNTKEFIDETFRDGIRAGIAANEIMQKISIPHQKNVFVTAMVHNIGKALLMAYDPAAFEKAFQASSGAKKSDEKEPTKYIRSEDAEADVFDFDHAQAGSLWVGRLPFLAEIERSIDYHHNPHLLKFSNPKLYALACVLRVSGGLSKLYQKARGKNPKIEGISDNRLTNSEDYIALKLTSEDWKEIKSGYALMLMKVGL